MLGIAYASVQFATFSKIFINISKQLLGLVGGLIKSSVDRVFTILYLKKIVNFIRLSLKEGIHLESIPSSVNSFALILCRVLGLLSNTYIYF